MRIGIDIRPLQSTSRYRGIGYYIRGLLAGLAEVGGAHEYVLLTIAGRPPPADMAAGPNHRALALPLAPPWWKIVEPVRYLRWLNPAHARRRGMRYDIMLRRRLDMARLAQAARWARLDVLHLSSVFEPEYFPNVGPRFPCPTVQTVYDLIPDVFPDVNRNAGWPFWHMRRMGHKSLAEGPGRVAAISESARQDVERFVPETRGRTETILCGVGAHFAPSPEEVRARVADKYGLRAGRYFLTNGGAEWRKNLPTVLAAFARFSPGEPDYRIVVPGRLREEDGAQVSRWAAAAGLPDGQVVRAGFVPDADLPALYGAATALVFPSRYEGFGLPVVEAMRCGCPVITARNSSLPEAAGDAALYVEDADDDADLARFMQQVAREPALAEDLRTRGLAWSRRFSWGAAALGYLGAYARAAKENTDADRV